MKLALLLFVVSTSSVFSYSVIDSMYEDGDVVHFERVPSSETVKEEKHCLVNKDDQIFAKSCYSNSSLCEKRLLFWQGLPELKPVKCLKF